MRTFDSGRAGRAVTAFLLIAWYIKWPFFVPYLFHHIDAYPVRHPLFPSFFMNPKTAQAAYLLPLGALMCFWIRSRKMLLAASLLIGLSSLTLLWHIDTYNDATFVVSFWVALWVFRLAVRDDTPESRDTGIILAQCILGMVFLGGFVGKLTPEYMSGDVVLGIFSQAPRFPFNWIQSVLEPNQLAVFFTAISLSIIICEGILACAPLMSIRWIGFAAPMILTAFMVFSTWRILSVVLPLGGLMAVCWLWDNEGRRHA